MPNTIRVSYFVAQHLNSSLGSGLEEDCRNLQGSIGGI